MIRLHSPLERVVMVSPERITHVKHDNERPERTRVYFDDDYITVTESPEEVARKVLEWRLAMERYRASCIAAASEPEVDTNLAMELNEKDLKELAGLEEPKNAHP